MISSAIEPHKDPQCEIMTIALDEEQPEVRDDRGNAADIGDHRWICIRYDRRILGEIRDFAAIILPQAVVQAARQFGGIARQDEAGERGGAPDARFDEPPFMTALQPDK